MAVFVSTRALLGHVTSVSKVPSRGSRIPGVGIVGSDLAIDTDRIENSNGQVDKESHYRVPERHDPSNKLNQEEKERNDGDGDIKVSKSAMQERHGQ